MILRPARPDDAPALARFGIDTFCAAFAHLYRQEDLAAFLEESYSVEAVAEEIAAPGCIHQLAIAGDSLTGFCKLWFPAHYAEHSDAIRPLTLGQLYIDPARTGQGIGALLMAWALAHARALECDAINLSVWAGNHGAQRFYQRYGFTRIADITFRVGQQLDEEFLYELRLQAGET